MRRISWGIFLFLINLFFIFENYRKNFMFDPSVFIQLNEFIIFTFGIFYGSRYKKFQPVSILWNCVSFSVLIQFLFFAYGCKPDGVMLLKIILFTYICMIIGHGLYIWLFVPTNRYKNKKIVK